MSAAESYPVQKFYIGIYNTNRNINSSNTALKSDTQNGTNTEEWSLNFVSSGVFEIVNSANDYVLTSNDSGVYLANDNDNSSQRWRIEGVEKDFDGYYLYYKSVFFFIVFSKWVLLVYQKTVDFYIFILYPIFL